MKFLALVSGGKDSVFAIKKCIDEGHELIAIGNLYAPDIGNELDSHMYQTVGTNVVEYISKALERPFYSHKIVGKTIEKSNEYKEVIGDEVEDLFHLIQQVKNDFPEIEAVSTGAIASNYQKNRVENVCGRLGLVSLAPLWGLDQSILLKEMIDCGMEVIILKTASFGLTPQLHLGKTIKELFPYFQKIVKRNLFRRTNLDLMFVVKEENMKV